MPQVDAVLVVDLQRAFVTGEHAVYDAAELVAVVSRLVARARAAGALVVHLQNDGGAGRPDEPGTPGWELYFEPGQDEPVIRKHADDGFAGTELESLLDRHGARAVAVCGLQSETCVAATARGATTRGLTVVLPRDAHSTRDLASDDRGGAAVPASHVRRVAEWSLGDQVVTPASSDEVDFRSPRPTDHAKR